ncbi:hypothetical protein B0T26DRAFT_747027 [Lasiosphaeria miniovina]|uniref:Uncharacterized protein n=1 Tax=Lasiosphaeria miniovina TaxID=1954250 RepID=A0AA40BJB0_9PEZI|nr:uncharacterized protein B0T26DRAFT_747027 [Lasiosphaeria miniovina]KAK0735212.1 hypothetical protein B0T26DRAFT_747027 [Lasiosphaeria miniovina]
MAMRRRAEQWRADMSRVPFSVAERIRLVKLTLTNQRCEATHIFGSMRSMSSLYESVLDVLRRNLPGVQELRVELFQPDDCAYTPPGCIVHGRPAQGKPRRRVYDADRFAVHECKRLAILDALEDLTRCRFEGRGVLDAAWDAAAAAAAARRRRGIAGGSGGGGNEISSEDDDDDDSTSDSAAPSAWPFPFPHLKQLRLIQLGRYYADFASVDDDLPVVGMWPARQRIACARFAVRVRKDVRPRLVGTNAARSWAPLEKDDGEEDNFVEPVVEAEAEAE